MRPGTILLAAGVLLAAALSLWARASLPIVTVADAGHDDGLFVSLALNIASGHWLGRYDSLTLIKGPGYPLFLAIAGGLGLPVKLVEHALYLLAAALLAWTFARVARSRAGGCLLFVALAANPALWTLDAQRINRESFYTGLSLGLFALVAWLALTPAGRTRGAWLANRRKLAGFAAGLLFAHFWLTREEGIWLLPALLTLLLAAVLRREPGRARLGFSLRRPAIRVPLAAGLGVALGLGVPLALNLHRYGVASTNDLKSGGFAQAYGAIMRIETGDWRPDIPFTPATAEAIATHSPTGRPLLAHLRLDEVTGWRRVTCEQLELDPCPQGIGAGWFLWALREAAMREGWFRTAALAQQRFGAMAEELNAACDSGALRCSARRAGIAPPFRLSYVGPTLRGMLAGGAELLDFRAPHLAWRPVSGAPEDLARFAAIAGPIPTTAPVFERPLMISGWVAGAEAISIEVGAPGVASATTITEGAVEDVVQHFARQGRPGLQALRFSIATDCLQAGCALTLRMAEASAQRVPLRQLGRGGRDVGDFTLHIGGISDASAIHVPLDERRLAATFERLRRFAHIYGVVLLALSPLVVPALILQLLRLRTEPEAVALLALMGGCLAAVLARLAVLAYIDATSFRALTAHYAMPATPFLIALVVISALVVLRAVTGRWRHRR